MFLVNPTHKYILEFWITYGFLYKKVVGRLQDHTGSSCGRVDHTTTIFLRVVLSHNHNHNIYFGGQIPEGSVQV